MECMADIRIKFTRVGNTFRQEWSFRDSPLQLTAQRVGVDHLYTKSLIRSPITHIKTTTSVSVGSHTKVPPCLVKLQYYLNKEQSVQYSVQLTVAIILALFTN